MNGDSNSGSYSKPNSNRQHGRSGHLFQVRYKAILVDADAHLLELTRYVVPNPVRAGMVIHPGNWSWSSYQAMTGEATSPTWLATDGLLAQFSALRQAALKRYIEFVGQGMTQESIWCALKRQIFLGDDQFVLQVQEKIKGKSEDVNVPKQQRKAQAHWKPCKTASGSERLTSPEYVRF